MQSLKFVQEEQVDRVRKELRMMVMDADKGLPYSKHCIPCGCSFKTIPILARKLVFKVSNFLRGAGGQVQGGVLDDGHGGPRS